MEGIPIGGRMNYSVQGYMFQNKDYINASQSPDLAFNTILLKKYRQDNPPQLSTQYLSCGGKDEHKLNI